jgi:hypothetical protein
MIACYLMAGNPTNITHQASHSPIPFLIGGVGAVLALVAFALFILACSFIKQSGRIQVSNTGGHSNNTGALVECREKKIEVCREDTEAKVMVIMAGDEKPTFLAEPAMNRAGDMENMV